MEHPKKKFDCVAFKDAAQRRIDALLKDCPTAEVPAALAGLAEQGALGTWWASIKHQAAAPERTAGEPVPPAFPAHE